MAGKKGLVRRAAKKAAKPPPPAGRQRRKYITYSRELAVELCYKLATGRSLTSICAEEGMPALRTVFDWLADREDREHRNFRDLYQWALDQRNHTFREQIVDIADNAALDHVAVPDGTNPDGTPRYKIVHVPQSIERAALRIRTRQWIMARMDPKQYGARQWVSNDPQAPFLPAVLGAPTVEVTNAEDDPDPTAAPQA